MKYFSINELTRSTTAARLGIDNTPPAEATRSLEALVANILDPLRKAYGKPIKVTSGYRCPMLNRAVGGARNSQHIKGEAADITAGSPTENLYIYNLLKNLPVDQAINEYNYSWIHVSYNPQRHRRQFFSLP